MEFPNILSRKPGKNANLPHQNMNPLKNQTETVSRFPISGMWKLSLDAENEPPVQTEPAAPNEPSLRNKRPPNYKEKKKYFMILKN